MAQRTVTITEAATLTGLSKEALTHDLELERDRARRRA
jgi:hypothetical protein